jgi:TetR/AcrR family transcriptional repressor of nem operon
MPNQRLKGHRLHTSQPPADIARLALSTVLGLRVLARTNRDRELLTGVVRAFSCC